MTTGEMPPGSNQGKFFVRNSKQENVKEINAKINLKFKAVN
jgi:hypothetical protein